MNSEKALCDSARDRDLTRFMFAVDCVKNVDCPTQKTSPLHATLASSLVLSAQTKNIESIVRILLEKGADPNLERKKTLPLQYAVRLSDQKAAKKVVKLLLAYGADPALKNSHGQTAEERALNDTMKVFMWSARCRYLQSRPVEVKKSRFCSIL